MGETTANDLPLNQVQKLRPGALISLYQLDVNPILSSSDAPIGIIYWVSAVDRNRSPITFRGITYVPMPIVVSEFDHSGEGKLPRPKAQISNIEGTVSALVERYYKLTGAKLTRLRTFEHYLDGAAQADPLRVLDYEVWYIGQPTDHTKTFCAFELHLPIDLENVLVPGRRILERCQWRYRDPTTCRWAGGAVDINNIKEGEPGYNGKDECNKSLAACQARFQDWRAFNEVRNPFPPHAGRGYGHTSINYGGGGNGLRLNTLPFGGFPGSGRVVR